MPPGGMNGIHLAIGRLHITCRGNTEWHLGRVAVRGMESPVVTTHKCQAGNTKYEVCSQM